MIHTHTHATVGEALSCHAQLVNRLPAYEAAVEALSACIEVFADGLGAHSDGVFCSLTDEGHAAIVAARAALARLREGEPSNV